MASKTRDVIELPPTLTVRELAEALNVTPIELIKTLMNVGVMASLNQTVDFDTAAIVAEELGREVRLALPEEEAKPEDEGELPLWRKWLQAEPEEKLQPRPPVVAVLGHVDHGKTTLLDAIRNTNVAEREAGGITQHIRAYQIEHEGQKITFIDTPGHAAFTSLRARGAKGADIVVLVVAADDGVMPQTREAINHARAARVPIVVAINKIDKPNARPERVRQQLADLGLIPQEWGGDTIMVEISARQRQNLDELLDAILLVAESSDIRANPQGRVFGTVIEAQRKKGQGVVATLLVQNGTLRVGDVLVAGTTYGKVRALFDHTGKRIKAAGPSTPVGMLGFHDIPEAGSLFFKVKNEKEARSIVEKRLEEIEQRRREKRKKVDLESLFEQLQQGEVKSLRLVIKVDVQGSLEPIVSSIQRIAERNEIPVEILHADVGNITENDVMLAAASNAIVIGFNVKADAAARRVAEREGVSIRIYRVIYELLEDIEKALKGLLEPEVQEVVLGEAEVLQVFPAAKLGKVAGCRVRRGVIRRNARVRVMRGDQVLYDGEIASLKRFKDDVREVREGFECGIGIKGFKNFQPGDRLVCYTLEERKPE
ncbi:MAG: translation initiation factor IF-2 [Chloroflexi bacterium]|nr:translation initiation factor IF-2 [Chloroflexota bacterium]